MDSEMPLEKKTKNILETGKKRWLGKEKTTSRDERTNGDSVRTSQAGGKEGGRRKEAIKVREDRGC